MHAEEREREAAKACRQQRAESVREASAGRDRNPEASWREEGMVVRDPARGWATKGRAQRFAGSRKVVTDMVRPPAAAGGTATRDARDRRAGRARRLTPGQQRGVARGAGQGGAGGARRCGAARGAEEAGARRGAGRSAAQSSRSTAKQGAGSSTDGQGVAAAWGGRAHRAPLTPIPQPPPCLPVSLRKPEAEH